MGMSLPKYDGSAPTGGLPSGSVGSLKPTSKLGLPTSMDLSSLMVWLTNKMRDSDASIRSKMADMNDRKVIQRELNDLIVAFRESRSGANAGAGYTAVKAPLDNPASIRSSEWFNSLDTNTRKKIEDMLSAVHGPAYVAGGTMTIDGAKYNMGDWMTPEAGERANEAAPGSASPLPPRIHKDQIDRAVQSLGDIAKNLSSNDEIQMIEMQSTISARGQLLQLVSNMIASFNESAKSIVGNIRG